MVSLVKKCGVNFEAISRQMKTKTIGQVSDKIRRIKDRVQKGNLVLEDKEF